MEPYILPMYKCEINAMRWMEGEKKMSWVVICDTREGRLQCHGCKHGIEI